MTDTLRSERPASAAEVPEREREARVEQLLLTGLDHYFGGRFDLAINVWTRVLFINHRHARARAYIERARSAIAERQRESDELLQTGIEAFRRGDTKAARHLLTSAAEHGAEPDETLAAMARLQRLESAAGPRPGRDTARESVTLVPARTDPRPSPVRNRPWATAVLVASAVFVLLVLAGVQVWLPQDAARGGVTRQPVEPLPVPTRAAIRVEAARAQQAGGHLREALATLEDVQPTDAEWRDADTLRGIIQQQLLTGAGTAMAARPDRTGDQR